MRATIATLTLAAAFAIGTACLGGGSDSDDTDTDTDDGGMPCAADVTDPVLGVATYDWNGETVYYFTMDCCDMFNVVYDDECNYICAPDGGFAGTGDGNCPTFWDDATKIADVWTAP